MDVDAVEQREGAVVELHRRAFGGLDGGGNLEQGQMYGGVRAKQLAAGDPEENRVADLTGGAGHRYADGGVSQSFISWSRSENTVTRLYTRAVHNVASGAARRASRVTIDLG